MTLIKLFNKNSYKLKKEMHHHLYVVLPLNNCGILLLNNIKSNFHYKNTKNQQFKK